MLEKILCTIVIVLLQITEIMYCHFNLKNKKFDICHTIYQIIILVIFQIKIWS